jgi:glycosyltransferase involved in cell wall biosynthesis
MIDQINLAASFTPIDFQSDTVWNMASCRFRTAGPDRFPEISRNGSSPMPRAVSLPDEPTVSVVVPFYGSNVRALVRCLESLLNQDYPKDRLTITVVDNNQTAFLQSSMFERCKLIHEPQPGSYAARNRGIRESFGDIVAFTDSDCIPQRSWISTGVEALNKMAVVVGGPISVGFESNVTRTTCELLDSIIHHRQGEYVSEHGFAATANLFVTRELISIVGHFDARFLSGGDREFGQRLAANGVPIVMAEDAVVMHPARTRSMDLLQKGLRGVGGEMTFLKIKKTSPWEIFRIQLDNYVHRQRLISNRAETLGIAPYQLAKLRALLTLIYIARILEAVRLLFGGKPFRV